MRSDNYAKVITLRTGLFIALALGAVRVRAADVSWTGANNTNWNNALNWLTVPPGGIPASGDTLIFNLPAPPNQPSNNDLSSLTLTGVTFDAAAGSHTLGGNGVNLGWKTTGAITHEGDIVNNSLVAQTINNPITLDASRHRFTTGTGALNLSGLNAQSKGSTAVFTDGGGGINLAGSTLNNVNGILGGWATIGGDWAVRHPTSNLVVPLGSAGVGTYTDVSGDAPAMIVDGPTTNVRISNTITPSTEITLADGTIRINSLLFSPSAGTQTVTIGENSTMPGVDNIFVLGQNGGIYNATQANANPNRTLNIGSGTAGAPTGILTAGDGVNPATITFSNTGHPNASGFINVNADITDNGTAPVSVVLMGGNATPSTAANNTFSGGLYIVSGRWSQPRQNTIGTGPVHIFPGGQINPGASGVDIIIPNNLFIAGHGHTENAGLGAIRMFQNTDGFSTALTGTITLVDTASVNSNGLTQVQIDAGRHVGIRGRITGPGGFMITSPTYDAANNNGVGIVEIGPLLGAAMPNDYAGDTTINGGQGAGPAAGPIGGALRIANPDADHIMPHGATGSFLGGPTGNLILNATNSLGRNATFDLNGTEQVINGLSSTATSPADNFVQNINATFPAHLIVGDNNATATFEGIIRDSDFSITSKLALTKIGSGTQTLSGANTYTGDTRVNGGTLSVSNPFLADTSNVGVGGSGVLDLNFVGTDAVNGFYLNGSPQAAGTWGSLTSTATNKTARISGTGILDVTNVGLLYGDYNNDMKVDAADYTIWRENDGTMNVLPNDAFGGTIGKYQYRQWAANFGASIGGSGSGIGLSAVPEPGAAVLALVAIFAGGFFRGRRGGRGV